jgi:hypothetical protein
LPVVIDGAVDVTFILIIAFGAIVGAVAVGPAILSWLCLLCSTCASTSLAASTSASTSLISVVASLVSIVASLISVAASVCVVAVAVAVAVVCDLGLKVGDGCHEMLQLFYHAVLLGCVRHFVLFGAQTFDYLVDDSGGIRLVVEAYGICCYGRLTSTLDVALGFLEMRLECWPGFFSVSFTVPLPDVTGEKRGSGDDDETDVDELGWRFSGFGRFGHLRVFVDGCEHGGDWLGMVLCRRLERGFGGG